MVFICRLNCLTCVTCICKSLVLFFACSFSPLGFATGMVTTQLTLFFIRCHDIYTVVVLHECVTFFCVLFGGRSQYWSCSWHTPSLHDLFCEPVWQQQPHSHQWLPNVYGGLDALGEAEGGELRGINAVCAVCSVCAVCAVCVAACSLLCCSRCCVVPPCCVQTQYTQALFWAVVVTTGIGRAVEPQVCVYGCMGVCVYFYVYVTVTFSSSCVCACTLECVL